MKKIRFGQGKWNGVGGKLNEGETIKEALVRETLEEINVAVKQEDLLQVATLNFTYKDNPEWDQQSHVFFAEKWDGESAESEEIIPKWYSFDSLPFENMWVDDKHWLPIVLAGKKIEADFLFNQTGDEILEMKINEIK